MSKHTHYHRDVSGLNRIDVYRILELFGVTCPVAQHIVKKALVAGQRGHKSARRDWQDIADSAARKLEMIDEDEIAAAVRAAIESGDVSVQIDDWPDETRRQDAAAEDEAFARIEPYTGQGGVMIRCPGCEALSCECRP